MVVPLGPGKFYGSSLPRPRIYTDIKHNTERVDPPVSVMDPFLSWASEAHWSMGGLNFKRLRLQGRIEGSVSKLRKEHEKLLKTQAKQISNDPTPLTADHKKRGSSTSPPPAPLAVKRRRFLALSDEEEEEEEEIAAKGKVVSYRRKLESEFDRVANEDLVGVKTRSKNSKGAIEKEELISDMKKKKAKIVKTEIRTSPRLARRGSK
ncbi:hypothetical protein Ddye_018607 [Dipteronia dyeriana]|uniref:Uncharacterized protein n=1 Tax=Dipteronia dyeriana TaxID=168575 RepID=A0AAD9UBD2_9ROSI|nr:hypothetical protein Ddye_018607 [Dipteronia dyeriana]